MIEIRTHAVFDKKFEALKKKYRSITQDYQSLLDELTTNPYQGIDLGNGIRKIRMAISDKSDRDNISDNELQALLDSVNE